MFSNCVQYNVGENGTWFRDEANRQKKLWNQIYANAKKNLKSALDDRKKVLKQAKASDQKNGTGKKRKPPPPLAFGLSGKSPKSGRTSGAAPAEPKNDAAINKLTVNDVDPLPPWAKRRKKEVDSNIPNMQCLAAMLLADPFVVRILLDKVLRNIRMNVKEKAIQSSMMLPSMIQMLNIAKISVQLCAKKGRKYLVPDAGVTLVNGVDESLSFKSIRRFLPLLSKMLLDVEVSLFYSRFIE